MKKEITQRIKEIVNAYDPVDLLKIGAPENEYAGEIQSIHILLLQNPNITQSQIETSLKTLFTERFSSKIVFENETVYTKMAHDLFQLVPDVSA